MMVYTESYCQCEECDSGLNDEDDIYCAGCYLTVRNERDALESDKNDLMEKIRELEQRIEYLEDDAEAYQKTIEDLQS